MSGRPEDDPPPAGPGADDKPASLGDVPITDRWAPLVRDPDRNAAVPPKLGQRMIAAALSLVALALLLWLLA